MPVFQATTELPGIRPLRLYSPALPLIVCELHRPRQLYSCRSRRSSPRRPRASISVNRRPRIASMTATNRSAVSPRLIYREPSRPPQPPRSITGQVLARTQHSSPLRPTSHKAMVRYLRTKTSLRTTSSMPWWICTLSTSTRGARSCIGRQLLTHCLVRR